MYRGCKAADPHYNIDDDDDEGLSDDQKILVYNEIRIIVMQMYVEVTEQFKADQHDEEDDCSHV